MSRVLAGTFIAAFVLASCDSGSTLAVVPVTTTTTPVAVAPTSTVAAPTTIPTVESPTVTVPATAPAWLPASANLVGLSSECGNLAYVGTRPDRDEIIVSVALQGLWSKKPGSNSFERLGRGAGSAAINNRASAILFDPTNPDIFWESGIHGTGVFKTTDGGATFRVLGEIDSSDPLAIDFGDPARATMLSGQHETTRLRRSTNSGATWNVVASFPAEAGFPTFPAILDSKTYLVGTQGGARAGIYRSNDAGATWTQVMAGDMNSVPLITKTGILWLMDNGALVRSVDQGTTWTPLQGQGFAVPYVDTMIRQLPDGNLITLGRTVLLSTDNGVTWRPLGPVLPFTPNGLVYSASEKAFFVWHFDCDFTTTNPIRDDSIMKLTLTG